MEYFSWAFVHLPLSKQSDNWISKEISWYSREERKWLLYWWENTDIWRYFMIARVNVDGDIVRIFCLKWMTCPDRWHISFLFLWELLTHKPFLFSSLCRLTKWPKVNLLSIWHHPAVRSSTDILSINKFSHLDGSLFRHRKKKKTKKKPSWWVCSDNGWDVYLNRCWSLLLIVV